MSRGAFDRLRDNRTPPRPPETRVGNPQGGGGSPSEFVTIRWNGQRNNRRYNGDILNDDGTLGAKAQFVIPNDTGIEPVLKNQDEVMARPCPVRLANLADWGLEVTYGAKYLAISITPNCTFR